MTATAVADFDRHECDIAVRLFHPTGDTLVARRMPDITIGLFAADTYLAGRDPASLALDQECVLVISDSYDLPLNCHPAAIRGSAVSVTP